MHLKKKCMLVNLFITLKKTHTNILGFYCTDDALTVLFKTFPKESDMFLSVYLVCSYLPKM